MPSQECSQHAWVRAQLSVGGGVYEGWAGLNRSNETGDTAFDQVHGCGFCEYYRRNPEAGAIFNEAMRLIGNVTLPQSRGHTIGANSLLLLTLVADLAVCW
jgi:hypothetical protein